MGFPGSSAGKESTCNAGDPGLIPGSGKSPGEGIGYPLQYSGLENSHGVMKSGTELSDFLFNFAVLIFSCKSTLYILDESLMTHALQIFSLVYGLPFYFCNNMFWKVRVFVSVKFDFLIFCLTLVHLMSYLRNLPNQKPLKIFSCFLLEIL